MGNMSYCRFQNTSLDLQDCIDEIEEMWNNNGLNEYDEELSYKEHQAMLDMIEQANFYYEQATELAELLENKKQ